MAHDSSYDPRIHQFQVTTPVDRTGDFSAPWCKVILEDPKWKPVPFGWQVSMDQPFRLNEFWTNTLSSPRSLRAVQGLARVDAELHTEPTSDPDSPHVLMLMSLGEGLMGAPGRLHGGFTATALDMILGFAVNATEKPTPISTANLTIDYKSPCFVPSVTLAKAWLVKRERRKRWLKATLEDENGKIIATADSLYVTLEPEVKREDSSKAKM